jgi:hypothetical protein
MVQTGEITAVIGLDDVDEGRLIGASAIDGVRIVVTAIDAGTSVMAAPSSMGLVHGCALA